MSVHKFREVQQCTLLSTKTGGCSEDCSCCPQSSRYNTGLKAQKLMNKDTILGCEETHCKNNLMDKQVSYQTK
jgi:biotin synthase-like enzyme